jgi:O-antigen/teichoic acid export membrane protein
MQEIISIRQKVFLVLLQIVDLRNSSRIKRNIILTAQANILAQILSYAFSPLMTRLYSPSDFGSFTVFSSYLALLSSFAIWRVDWSVPNAKSQVQAVSVMLLGFTLLSILSTILFSASLLFRDINIFMLSLLLFYTGNQQIALSWHIREADLSLISKSRVYQSILGVFASIIFGLFHFGTLGLIFSTLISTWVGLAIIVRGTKIRAHIRRLSYKRIYTSLRRFWREATASTLASIVNTASLTAIPLLLSRYYSATEIGWYVLMYRLALLPLEPFLTAISQSFWAEAVNLVRTSRVSLKNLHAKLTFRLMIVSVPMSLVALFGPLYVGFIFGDKWSRAGYILIALIPLIIGTITIPTLSHLAVHRKQHWQMVWDIARLSLLALTIVFCGSTEIRIELTVLIISIVMSLMYLVLLWLNLICLGENNVPRRVLR